MNIENKLTYLDGTKDAIKQAIIGKGVSVTEADTFRSYAEKIGQIQGGGTHSKYTGNADAEGLKAIGWTNEDIQYYQENGVNWNEEDDEYHKVPQENIDLYGVLNQNNISTYKNYIVYLPKIEITKTSLTLMFNNCNSLVSIPQLDTSNVTDMYSMFGNCYSLVSIPQLDTSNVTRMNRMFNNCYSLVSIPQLDTSNVTDYELMFDGCYSLVSIPQLDTSNSAKSSTNMFRYCYSLVSIPQLDTSNFTSLDSMFTACFSLQHIKIRNLSKDLSLVDPKLLSKESLLYMIQNSEATSAITITLSSNVYDKYVEDPDIVSALSAQPNITLEK